MTKFTNPTSDEDMTYNNATKRYVLTEAFVRDMGIDLSLSLYTEHMPEPSKAPELFLNRVSLLVYSNIYSYGRNKEDKEYIMACNPNLRDIIKEAMMERVAYIVSSGDLSTKAGAIIEQGTRIDTQDLIASPQEENMLRTAGLLHRGDYLIFKDKSLVY